MIKITPRHIGHFASIACLVLLLNSIPKLGHATTIFVAVRAHAGEAQALKKWGPTIDYLDQALPEYQVRMLPYTSIRKQLADAKKERFHFLLTNPATYVELEISSGARAILTLINNRRGSAQTRFGSVIFTHADNTDILHLRDLKGKRVAGVSPLGFGGWLVGARVLLDHGIHPQKDFTSLTFPGKQPKVVEAVLSKKVHAGIVRTDMLERLADQGKINLRQVRVLRQLKTPGFPFFQSSPLYPEWPFAVMPNTDAGLTARVKQALLLLDRHHPAARAGKYMGWTGALDYQPVKTLLADLGVGPFSGVKTKQRLLYIPPIVFVLLVAIYFFRRYSIDKTD